MIDVVVFFENKRGRVIVPPDHRHPVPQGYERKEAKTLAEVDRLTRRLNAQDQTMFDDLFEKDREIMRERREKTRSTLRQRMLAIDCTQFEKRFILGALAYLNRKEEEMYKHTVNGYFHAREYDAGHEPTENYGKQLSMPRMSDRLAALMTK